MLVRSKRFKREIESDDLILIYFSSPACIVCKKSDKFIEKLDEAYSNLKVLKIDAGRDLELTNQFGVSKLPTFIVMRDKKVLGRSESFRNEIDVEKVVRQFI